MEKLQRIIAKLESKLQPLHDENVVLKSRVDDLELDNEVALEHIEALEQELAEAGDLAGQIESLEQLKLISEELEAHQRDEIAALEAQLAELSAPTTRATEAESLQHELRLLRLELEASQLALQAHKKGLLVVFREQIEFDLPRAQYEMALCGDKDVQARLEQLFDEWRLGNVGRAELEARLQSVLDQCTNLLLQRPKFDATLAKEYLATINPAALELSDRAAAKALEDPERIEELLNEQDYDLSNVSVTSAPAAPAAPVARSDEMELKLEIASQKAAKAAALAQQLDQVRASLQQTEALNGTLASQVEDLRHALQAQEDQYTALKAAQVPELDTITYRQTLALLSESIKLLRFAPQPLVLGSLNHKPRGLSAFAGSQIVRQVWDAVDSFEAPQTSGERVRQMRILSLIDA